jgi:hypothetical protein
MLGTVGAVGVAVLVIVAGAFWLFSDSSVSVPLSGQGRITVPISG